MKQEIFTAKAAEMGDFYVYFTDDKNTKTFCVATADLSTQYIRDKLKGRKPNKLNREEQVQVWDWNRDRLVVLNYASVTKLVPLSTVLKNGQ